jgi:hypothetical protein
MSKVMHYGVLLVVFLMECIPKVLERKRKLKYQMSLPKQLLFNY